jgi:SAM-dependent methyltransferase
VVGDIGALDLPHCHYDAIISIDTLYFSDNYTRTIRQLARALSPGGRLGILYSHGREPGLPENHFRADTLAPECTPLAEALVANNLSFRTWDFTGDDYLLAQVRQQVLEDLRPRFEAESLMFVYDNRMGEALGIAQAIEEGLHKRYLYLAQRSQRTVW